MTKRKLTDANKRIPPSKKIKIDIEVFFSAWAKEQREILWKQILEDYSAIEVRDDAYENKDGFPGEDDEEIRLLELKVQNRLLEQEINNYHERLQEGDSTLSSNSEIIIEMRRALEYLLKTLVSYQEQQVQINSSIADLFGCIGKAYNILGEVNNGLVYQLYALKIKRELYDEVHADIAVMLNDIGVSYCDLGKNLTSLKYFQKSLDICKELYKEDNLSMLTPLKNIVSTYEELGDIDAEINCRKQVLKIQQKLQLDDKLPMVANIIKIGTAYKKLDNLPKELKYQEQALKEIKAINSVNPLYIAGMLNNISGIHYKLNDIKTCILYMEQALSIYQTTLSTNQQEFARALSNAGSAYGVLGDKLKSLELNIQAYILRKNLLGENHPDTLMLKEYLLSANEISLSFLDEIRTPILQRGNIDKETIEIKQIIQQDILNKIQVLVCKNQENLSTTNLLLLDDNELKDYLDNILCEKLGELLNDRTIEIGRMLCMEAVCLGTMHTYPRNTNYIEKFIKSYPEVFFKVVKEHLEYFVDTSLADTCIKYYETEKELIGDNDINNNVSANDIIEY